MNKKLLLLISTLELLLLQSTFLSGQTLLKQINLKKFGIAPANYSGIVHVAADSFAVIDDKSAADGFIPFRIVQDKETGQIKEVYASPLLYDRTALSANSERSKADCEDITYVPELNTYFIASEAWQKVYEYDDKGCLTGRQLSIPSQFSPDKIQDNCGFESLTYNQHTGLFWTTTEAPLIGEEGTVRPMLRLQSFYRDLQPASQWAYRMEAATMKPGKYYAHGVSAMLALDDGRLLVLERELTVPTKYVGSKTNIRIFVVNPLKTEPIDSFTTLKTLNEARILKKREVFSFVTNIKIGKLNYANYEGMALGAKLADGRQSLLLICDSQAGAGNGLYQLKDYIKVIILPEYF